MGNTGCFSRGPAGRWRYLPRVAPWLLSFVRAGRGERVAAQAAALARLLAPVHECLQLLLAEAGASELARRDGSLIVYRTEAGWAGGQAGWSLRRANGIEWEELDGDALRALDPGLAPGLFRGVKLPGNGHTIDPHALAGRLAGGSRATAAGSRRRRPAACRADRRRTDRSRCRRAGGWGASRTARSAIG